MQKVEDLITEIETLTPEEFAGLRNWFADKDWGRWDKQLEDDIAAGKLDFLVDEAHMAKEAQQLRDL